MKSEFDLFNEDEQCREVYAKFGLAIYFAQVIEYGVLNLIICIRATQKRIFTLDDYDSLFSIGMSKTMGQLINEIKNEYKFSDYEYKELKDILKQRN